ncbi:MAG: hypothetical protein HRT36_05200 [Alphaproteobacteria bacterium]|nr:hypothetical protein [Alphaproteobacteria bacterium]
MVLNTADLLLRQLEAVLNTNIGGKYLFSGNQYQSPALKDLTKLQTLSYTDVQNPKISQFQTSNSLPQGAVHFRVGETSKFITVKVTGDKTAESLPEQFKLHLSGVTLMDGTVTGSKIVEPDALGSIKDNDTTVSITNLGPKSLEEGDTYSFVVHRKGGDLTVPTTVNLSGLNGTNVVAGDFVSGYPPSVLTFAANETSKTITVRTNNDGTVEDTEHFAVRIDPSATYIVDGNAQVVSATINDNDSLKSYLSVVRTSAVSQTEDSGGAHVFEIRRQNPALNSEPQVVKWSIDLEKSTIDAADFGGTVPSGSVTFLADETVKYVTINVNNDQKIEQDETFQVKIEGTDVVQSHAESRVTNDEVAFGIKPLDADRAEGGSHTFVVTRSGDASVASTIDVEANYLSDGSSVGATQTINFAAGETQRVISFVSTARTADDAMELTLKNSATTGYGSYIQSFATTAQGKVYDTASASGTVSVVGTPTVIEGDNAVTRDLVFQVIRTDSTREEYVSYGVQTTNRNSADEKDFVDGHGVVPTYTATDAGGTTQEVTYMYDKVPGQRDPLLWQQQSVGLRDGESQSYGVSATDPAFQKLIRSLIILKSTVENRNTGQEKIMLAKAREIVNEATTEVRQLVAANAIAVNGIATTRKAHISFNTLAKNKLGAITDIDAAEAAAKVMSLQAMVNASYLLIAKRAKLSLANFL